MKRFWDKVEKTENCWFWTAGGRGKGYGAIKVNGKLYDAHRVVWFLTYGKWPQKFVLHRCNNRSCVNPDHLYEGTQKENVRDSIVSGTLFDIRKARKLQGEEKSQHKLTTSDVIKLREMYKNGINARILGEKFKILRQTAWKIATGRNWSWLPL
jgi:hypothetical protein